MPLVEISECDGPSCESTTKDYVESGWLAVPCISWFDGYKESEMIIGDREPKYKKCIAFDEGRGSKLFCGWDCFSKAMHE